MSKHLRIEFMDGKIAELDSRWDFTWTEDGVLRVKERNGAYAAVGPAFPLYNIRRYEFVEGYR